MQPISKIICPLDLSKEAESALDRAAEFARSLGAEIELLHVYQLSAFAIPAEGETLQYIDDLKREANTYLTRVRERMAETGLRVSLRLIEGEPHHMIVEYTKSLPGCMIAMSTHGRTGFKRLVLGSVTERVVRAAEVPVLVVQAV